MDLGDMMGKAEEMVKNVSDDQIDEAVKAMEEKLPESMDSKLEMIADQAKKMNN